MKKFLEKNKLLDDGHNTDECYLIEVFHESEGMVDMLHAYCFLDLIRIQSYYLKPNGRFWYTIKVTKC